MKTRKGPREEKRRAEGGEETGERKRREEGGKVEATGPVF